MPLLVSPHELNDGYLRNQTYDNLIFEQIQEMVEFTFVPENTRIFRSDHINFVYLRLDSFLDETLSILRLKRISINDEEYYEANKSLSLVKRKGYSKCLYEYAIRNLDFPIITDSTHTKPGSSDLWKKFQQNQDTSGYEILVFNTKTNHKSKFIQRNYNDYDIWGWHEDFTYMAREDPKFLQDAVKAGDMNLELYQFLNNDIKKIRDRSHIRLIARRL